MARGMGPRMPKVPMPKAPKPIEPTKAVSVPPRLKPISTRDYGKGSTPLSSGPNMGVQGAGIGYGGPKPFGTI